MKDLRRPHPIPGEEGGVTIGDTLFRGGPAEGPCPVGPGVSGLADTPFCGSLEGRRLTRSPGVVLSCRRVFGGLERAL